MGCSKGKNCGGGNKNRSGGYKSQRTINKTGTVVTVKGGGKFRVVDPKKK